MLSHIAAFVLSLAFLIKGSDWLVEACAKLAKKLGTSELVIGLTITAIGTSVPELASAVSASIQNSPELVFGNVIGSNIANIGLILGIAAVITRIKIDERIYHRDGFILILGICLFYLFAYNGRVSALEALLLIALYVLYIMFLLKTRGAHVKKYAFHDFMQYFLDFKYMTTVKSIFVKDGLKKKEEKRTSKELQAVGLFEKGLFKDTLIIIGSICAVALGAKVLVSESIWFANYFLVPQSLIGISVIAIGTSLPELTVSIGAARKGHADILIGNILGSNIANLLLVIGTSAIIKPLAISQNAIIYSIPIMGFFSIGLVYAIKNKIGIGRREGALALIAYALFIFFAFTSGLV